MFWMWTVVLCFSAADGKMPDDHSTLSVSAPHLSYTCPVGATVKLECAQRGAPLNSTDILQRHWLFTSNIDKHCREKVGPRHLVHGNHGAPPGVRFYAAGDSFWVELQNVSKMDQGRYCCLLLDIKVNNKHGEILQKPHSHVVLYITPRVNGSQECTVVDSKEFPAASPVGAVLATTACIIALLSLPLILVLVYKQRHSSQSSRRAHELVRMDSEACGHENPVFMPSCPEPRTRTVSQIMTRQGSETGRHLLSDPGTPLSPSLHGDVFFPAQDPIPESPDFMQV